MTTEEEQTCPEQYGRTNLPVVNEHSVLDVDDSVSVSSRKSEEGDPSSSARSHLSDDDHTPSYGAPDEMEKRKIIFDSLSKLSTRNSSASDGAGRGTLIYSWGAGYTGQLGQLFDPGQPKYSAKPLLVVFPRELAIRQVACGGFHTAALTDTGVVWTWGDGRMGQLGHHANAFRSQFTPAVVESLEGTVFVKEIACGLNHTAALSSEGKVFTWGWGKHGQLGTGFRQNSHLPKELPEGEFIRVSCGARHTAAVSAKGRVYTWGNGDQGQLGHPERGDVLKPRLVESLLDIQITALACGAINTAVLTDVGDLYVWGFGEHLFPTKGANFAFIPRKLDFTERIEQVACGQGHVALLTKKGDVYCWGAGEFGQLGHGVMSNLDSPRLILKGKQIHQVSCGRYHTSALTTNGVLYTWGCGENGQLGHDSDMNEAIPRVIRSLLHNVAGQVACGEHHTTALTSYEFPKIPRDLALWADLEDEEYRFKLKLLGKNLQKALGKNEWAVIFQQRELWSKNWEKTQESNAKEMKQRIQSELDTIKSYQNLVDQMKRTHQPVQLGYDDSTAEGRLETEEELSDKTFLLPIIKHDVSSPIVANKAAGASKRLKFPRLSITGTITTEPKKKGVKDRFLSPTMKAILSPRVDAYLPEASVEKEMSGQFLVRSPSGNPSRGSSQVNHLRSPRIALLKGSHNLLGRLRSEVETTGEVHQESMVDAQQTILKLRQKYDFMKQERNRKAQLLAELETEFNSKDNIAHSVTESNLPENEKKNNLSNELETIKLRNAEAQENMKNYRIIVAHLKEEQGDHTLELQHLKNLVAETENIYTMAERQRDRAMLEKRVSKVEIQDMESDKVDMKKFLEDQIRRFRGSIGTIRKAKAELEAHKTRKVVETHKRQQEEISRLENIIHQREILKGELLKELEVHNERCAFFDERFSEIAAVTGTSDWQQIIDRFANKEKIKDDINKNIYELRKRVSKLEQEKLSLEEKLRYLQNAPAAKKWKDLDASESRLESSKGRFHRMKNSYVKAYQTEVAIEGQIEMLITRVNQLLVGVVDPSVPKQITTPLRPIATIETVGRLLQKLRWISDQVSNTTSDATDEYQRYVSSLPRELKEVPSTTSIRSARSSASLNNSLNSNMNSSIKPTLSPAAAARALNSSKQINLATDSIDSTLQRDEERVSEALTV
eukprot:GILJ01002023.1.p1 GENE.GILJ01002023.1~~GILJ01002023.1.p1  ORF type:complete len:1186 (+),score=191.03 GILJ01002023.1:27-3560(+)